MIWLAIVASLPASDLLAHAQLRSATALVDAPAGVPLTQVLKDGQARAFFAPSLRVLEATRSAELPAECDKGTALAVTLDVAAAN